MINGSRCHSCESLDYAAQCFFKIFNQCTEKTMVQAVNLDGRGEHDIKITGRLTANKRN